MVTRRKPTDLVRTAIRARLARLLREVLADHELRAAQRHTELLARMSAWERRQRRDVFTALDRDAAATSATLVRSDMPTVALFVQPHDTLRHALQAAPGHGLALEFGVASGTTLRIIVETRPDLAITGFDCFEGLPEPWRLGFDRGAFAVPDAPEVPGAALEVGLFADTLPAFLAREGSPVAFVHLDADLYSSTSDVLALLGPRLRVGTVLLFDEYFNYPGWQKHEFKAWTDYTTSSGVTFEYLGLTMDDEQVSVRITGL